MLKTKNVLITGSSHGIGKETALLFAKEKANVIVTFFKDKKSGESVLRECKSLGSPKPLLVRLDVTDTSSIKAVAKELKQKYGYIDILINNAGVISWENLRDQTFKDIENQVRTNLEGLIKVTKAFSNMVKGSILNISSGAGQEGHEGISVYASTKFGVRGFTQAVAEELDSVNVYVINPGMTATRMTGFRGEPAPKVAAVILNAALGKYEVASGGDINVWDYID